MMPFLVSPLAVAQVFPGCAHEDTRTTTVREDDAECSFALFAV